MIREAKARGAAIVGIFHDETYASKSPTACTQWESLHDYQYVKLVLENEVVHGSLEMQDGESAPLPKARVTCQKQWTAKALAATGAD